MKNKNSKNQNYLECKPKRNDMYAWSVDNGIVTIEIENRGLLKKITQVLFKKPKISYIHLDDMGSFIWPIIDGEKDVIEIGKEVKEKFGEGAEPLYERLAKYFQILDSYGFIKWN